MTSATVLCLFCWSQAAEPPKEPVPDANRQQLIERALESMRGARAKLAEAQTGKATQDLQQQALAALDELLKTPPPPPSPSQSGQGGGGSSQNSPSSSSPPSSEQKSATSASEQKTAQERDSQPGSQRERSEADDSEERTGQRRAGVAAPLPRRRLEVDVWGHLPEKVRDQLLNSYGERMVPQYESLVRRFYESLADTAAESAASPRKP